MDRNWILFQRNTNDERTPIFLDLHLQRHSKPSQYPHLLTFFINIYHIAESDEQAKRIQRELNEIEEKLDKLLQDQGLGIFIGRIDSPTRLEYLFYVKEPEEAKSCMLQFMQEYGSYRHYVQYRDDEHWSFYKYLQPSQEEKMFARNSQILRSLDYEGYRTGVSQRVHHQLVFQSKHDLDEAKEVLSTQHFRIEHFDYVAHSPGREYRLHVSHDLLLEEETLNEATKRLNDMIGHKGGKYEGWGIVPQEKAIRKWKQLLHRAKIPAFLLVFVVVCSAIGLLIFGHPRPVISNPLAVGKLAPVFKLQDQNDNMVQIGGGGRPQVLNFCDASLEPCRKDLQQLETLATEAKGKAEVISVCFPRNPAQPMKYESSFPIVYDKEQLVAYHAYQVKRFPVTFFINSAGKIVDVVEAGQPNQRDRRIALNELK